MGLALFLLLVDPVLGVAGEEQLRQDVIAVPAPMGRVKGRVLEKDGVTPVSRADLLFTGIHTGLEHHGFAHNSGRFSLELPLGEYSLKIRRRFEIYESPSVYKIPPYAQIPIDFLLLRNFEPAGSAESRVDGVVPGPGPGPGPDPRRDSAEVVGSVVDMPAPVEGSHRHHHWAEVLGFIGSLIAVVLASG